MMELKELISILEKYPLDCEVKTIPDEVYNPEEKLDYKKDFVHYDKDKNEIII